MKKLNKVNVKRNDTVAAFACRYECAAKATAIRICDHGSQVVGYTYVTNSVSNYHYHK